MPRIRTVKPQHWGDKELPNISLQAHLLWIGIWNFSDDKGVIENDPLLIKSNVFPRRSDVRVEQVSQWIDQLVKARFLVPFTFNGEGYYVSRTFETHQRIDRPQPSKVPSDVIRRIVDEHSTNVRPCIVRDSIVEELRESAHDNDLFFEKFRSVTDRHITDKELELEVAKFKNKYPNIHSNQAGALINAWVANIGKEPIRIDPKLNKNSWI